MTIFFRPIASSAFDVGPDLGLPITSPMVSPIVSYANDLGRQYPVNIPKVRAGVEGNTAHRPGDGIKGDV
jgi:hypothetical protein